MILLLLLLSLALLCYIGAQLLLFSNLIRGVHSTSELRLSIKLKSDVVVIFALENYLVLPPLISIGSLLSFITSLLPLLILAIPSDALAAQIWRVPSHIRLGFHVVTNHFA